VRLASIATHESKRSASRERHRLSRGWRSSLGLPQLGARLPRGGLPGHSGWRQFTGRFLEPRQIRRLACLKEGLDPFGRATAIAFFYHDQPLELALCMQGSNDKERGNWSSSGGVYGTPGALPPHLLTTSATYRSPVANSVAPSPPVFGCNNAWVSDRSLCYLASAKPVIVQHTAPAASCPRRQECIAFGHRRRQQSPWNAWRPTTERQCSLARALVEEHFDARNVVSRTLELTMG
jgi:hypothetical protein